MWGLVFLFGYGVGALTVLGWLLVRRSWRQAYGPPPSPQTPAQKGNQAYYEDVVASRAAWRSTRLGRRTQRNAARRNRSESTEIS